MITPLQAEQSYHDVSELWDEYLDLDFFKPLLGALNRLNVHELREMLLENFFYSIGLTFQAFYHDGSEFFLDDDFFFQVLLSIVG